MRSPSFRTARTAGQRSAGMTGSARNAPARGEEASWHVHRQQATRRADRCRDIPEDARRSRRRLFLRQSRHRFSADRRSLHAARKQTNAKFPQPVLVPHENLAVAMAHGAYLMTGRPQAVMVHVNVGTANTINNLTNLSRDRAPLILCAGRTPFTEKGSFGSRTPLDPLGAGNVRSGRHAARNGEMGLRTEGRRTDRRRRRARL